MILMLFRRLLTARTAYAFDTLFFYVFFLLVYNSLLLPLHFLFLLIGEVAHSTLVALFFSLFFGMGGGTCVRIGMNGNDDMVAEGKVFCLCKRLGLECKKRKKTP